MSNVGFHFGKIQDGYLRQPRTAEYQGVIKLHASIRSKAPNDGVAKFYEICCQALSKLLSQMQVAAEGDINKLIFSFGFPLIDPLPQLWSKLAEGSVGSQSHEGVMRRHDARLIEADKAMKNASCVISDGIVHLLIGPDEIIGFQGIMDQEALTVQATMQIEKVEMVSKGLVGVGKVNDQRNVVSFGESYSSNSSKVCYYQIGKFLQSVEVIIEICKNCLENDFERKIVDLILDLYRVFWVNADNVQIFELFLNSILHELKSYHFYIDI